MSKFDVEVERIVRQTFAVTVEAASREEALTKGTDPDNWQDEEELAEIDILEHRSVEAVETTSS